MTHDQIRSLLEWTTDGKWETLTDLDNGLSDVISNNDGEVVAQRMTEGDADFLSASKSIVRQLLEENEELKSCIESMATQFGYMSDDGKRLTTGGLSDLERAFHLLGWDNPHKI